MRSILYFFLVIFVVSISSSCIKDADDEEVQPPLPVNDSIPMANDSIDLLVDSAFTATIDYLTGNWMSEYTGFDPMQGSNSAIRRFVAFYSDGSYDSHVQGTNNVETNSVISYKEFEHEHGTYSFNAEKQLMVYHVEYDSLLNFFTDKLEYNAGKVVRGTIVKDYNEVIQFSYEKEGKRDWIRIDENLRSTDNHSARLVYIMKNQ